MFSTNPDHADILGDTDFDFENFFCVFFFYPRIPDSWISRFLDFQIPGSWNQVPDYGWHQSPDLGGFWTALPDHRIQEIQGTRQYREKSISASLVWGIIIFFESCAYC